MQGVVGDDGIAHGAERAAARRLVDEPRQQSRPPGDAGVGGCRPAVRRGAPALVPARLEEGDDRRAEGEAVRLDLRLVLALRVHRRVPGELEAQHLAVGRHPVDPLRNDHVASGAAAHVVARPVELDADPVCARAAVDEVATGATLEKVGASATREPIVPTVAADRVGRLRAVQRVRSRRARDRRTHRRLGGDEGGTGQAEGEALPAHRLDSTPPLLRSRCDRPERRAARAARIVFPRGHSSAGRASGWQPEGRRFEPGWLHDRHWVHAPLLMTRRMRSWGP